MSTMQLVIIILTLIKSTICYNIRKTCPAVPVQTRLPFQCENVASSPGLNASCDPNGNYPYLLTCQLNTTSPNDIVVRRANNTCIASNEETNAICCNGVIKDWHQIYQPSPNGFLSTCPNDYQITGCSDDHIHYENNACLGSVAECHKIPSNQELHCVQIDSNSTSDICPNNYTMTWCNTGIVTYNEKPTGQCSNSYNSSRCCVLYELEAFNSNPYVRIDNKILSANVEQQCMDTYGTHAASIHTQKDFIQAYNLCSELYSDERTFICCLGGHDTKTADVWKWNDGSGTFPPNLKWSEGGLWKALQPENRDQEDYACIFASFPEYGLHDCKSNTEYECYPLCNAPAHIEKSDQHRRLSQTDELFADTCFAMEITLNVENILPDPQYILPQTNIDVIDKALQQTLRDHDIDWQNISIAFEELEERRRMQSNDDNLVDEHECEHASDDSIDSFYFDTIAYNISCDNDTLIINNKTTNGALMTVQCEFTTEHSIVYVWSIDKVICSIKSNCLGLLMQANIMHVNGSLLASREDNFDEGKKTQEFVFTDKIFLNANTTYVMSIDVLSGDECVQFKFEELELAPLILSMAQPSSCELGSALAVDASMQFGLGSFCNPNASETRQSFEDMLYQKHSSDQVMDGVKWSSLPWVAGNNTSIRRRLPTNEDVPGCGANCSSLDIVFADGSTRTIADDNIFPCYSQCIAIDDDTFRVFAVGGQVNGTAIDRLKVYQIDSQSSAYLIENNADYMNLTLDKPRAATMCYYYKNIYDNNKEYIMVINGVNNTKDLKIENNHNIWYNDIVFIPLNKTERNNKRFPQIKLKYNVIDMRPFITQSNELYLFGGRNGVNATNYIQVIDLDQIFAASPNDILTTYDRMEPMQTNAVIPFVDFPTLQNETCIMIIGGQDYINKQWIDTKVPLVGLQLYCNEILIAHLKNSRRRLNNDAYENNNVEFTEFDKKNLQKSRKNETKSLNDTNIIIKQYNFTNDNILYEFSVSFQICFEKQNDFKRAIDLFHQNNTFFKENILVESQRNYKGWSFGFGAVNIENINIFVANKSLQPTFIPTSEPTNMPTITTNIPTEAPHKKGGEIKYQPTKTPSISPTRAPTDNDGKKISLTTILIIVFSIIGVVIIAIIIYFVYKKIKQNQNPFERLAFDSDDETEIETEIEQL